MGLHFDQFPDSLSPYHVVSDDRRRASNAGSKINFCVDLKRVEDLREFLDEMTSYIRENSEDSWTDLVELSQFLLSNISDEDGDTDTPLLFPKEFIDKLEHMRTNIMTMCEICQEVTAQQKLDCCNSFTCNECLKCYLTLKVLEGENSIICPGKECNTRLATETIRSQLDLQIRMKYDSLLVETMREFNCKTCPGCAKITFIDSASLQNRKSRKNAMLIHCDSCFFSWCFTCHTSWHRGHKCKQSSETTDPSKLSVKEGQYKDRSLRNLHPSVQCKKLSRNSYEGCHIGQQSVTSVLKTARCGNKYLTRIPERMFGHRHNKPGIFGWKKCYPPSKSSAQEGGV